MQIRKNITVVKNILYRQDFYENILIGLNLHQIMMLLLVLHQF